MADLFNDEEVEIVTTGELAELLGVTPQRISQLVGEGMPKLARGKFDAQACVEYYETMRASSSPTGKVAELRARVLESQARAHEIRNDILLGNVYTASVVNDALQAIYSAIVQACDAEIGPLEDPELRRWAEGFANNVRRRTHAAIEARAVELERGADPTTRRIRSAV